MAQAKSGAAELKKVSEHLGDIVKVITTMTTAVTYGSKIVAKIITL